MTCPHPPVVYDILRLVLGIFDRAPRGIDRVDLAYARFLFEQWPVDCAGVMLTPWGPRLWSRRQALRILDVVESKWRENGSGEQDPGLTHIKRCLSGAVTPGGTLRRSRGSDIAALNFARISGLWSLLSSVGIPLGAPAVRSTPPKALYINVGQLGWAAPWTTGWLRRRPDVHAIFMIHDVIPLEHPELIAGPGAWAHRRIIAAAARHASGIICTTESAREAVLGALRHVAAHGGRHEGRHGGHHERHPTGHHDERSGEHGEWQPNARADRDNSIYVETIPLPVAPVFLNSPSQDPSLHGRGYFVVCGAIEPRKNHLLLLAVWRKLVASRGADTPKLIVVGRTARGGKPILQAFEDCSELAGVVIVATGLSSPALRDLMAHATAVLMPSLAEGFGLPIIEALALGTPVLASNLPSHQEAGGNFVIYLDPADEATWLAQIGLLADGGEQAMALRERIRGFRPMTSSQYNCQLARFLRTFA